MTVTPTIAADVDEPARRQRAETYEKPPGVGGWLAAVSHKSVGKRYVATAFAFFLIGGVEALLIRTQLIVPNADVVGPNTYNELFTMHGSTMMYLFVVPFLEGVANYLVPLMIGTRDLPFPRLNAFNYWLYLFGGLLLYSSFLFGAVPDGGWYAYPPLVLSEYSPGSGMNFWLIGITLAEISAIGAAIEIIVVIFKHRAPGMSLARMPLFVWAILVASFAIVFAFTVLLASSVMLQLDRSFGTRFFDPEGGGSPILWQHLFWVFGHPEVYIMFIPATGIVSQVVQTFSRGPIVGYVLLVAALVATGVLSFGLWVHHMFTVGLPLVSLGIFSAASYMITFPTGVQFFSWITTIWTGRPQLRVPLMYVVAFLVTFVMGGVTGVMVATVPMDFQVHDTYFLIAHFHYVLIGGVVFPALAAIHYWYPKLTGRLQHHRLSVLSFWLVVLGFHVAFFPMHITGLVGMPRRVYTYEAARGWAGLNLVSSLGAYVLGLGVLLLVANLAWTRYRGARAEGDPWGADTLEWSTASPPPPENFAAIPVVTSRHPRWDAPSVPPPGHLEPALALAHTPLHWRVALGTTPATARPSELIFLPGPTRWPLLAGVGGLVAAVGLLTGSTVLVGVGALVLLVGGGGWLLAGERERAAHTPGFEVAGLGVDVVGPRAVGWWGNVWLLAVLISALGTIAFSYFFLATEATTWPVAGEVAGWAPAVVTGAAVGATALLALLLRAASVRPARGLRRLALGGCAAGALASGAAHVLAYLWAGAPLDRDAYGSLVLAYHGFGVVLAAFVLGTAAYAIAVEALRGAGPRLRLVADNLAMLAWFSVVSWAVTVASLQLWPRL